MMMELRAVGEEAVREVERKGKLWRNLLEKSSSPLCTKESKSSLCWCNNIYNPIVNISVSFGSLLSYEVLLL